MGGSRPIKHTGHQSRKSSFCKMGWLCSATSTGWPRDRAGQESVGLGSALLFLLCPTCPHLRHGESIPSALEPCMMSTSQHRWINLSVMFFYFSSFFFPFPTHLEKHFVWPLWCENSLSKEKTNHAMKLGFGMTLVLQMNEMSQGWSRERKWASNIWDSPRLNKK